MGFTFCLQEIKEKGVGLIILIEKISRDLNIQAVPAVQPAGFSQACNEIWRQYTAEKIEKLIFLFRRNHL